MTTTARVAELSRGQRILRRVEIVGNKIPDPFLLVLGLMVIVALLSWLLSSLGVSAVNPLDGETISVVNALTGEGILTGFTGAAENYMTFPPLAPVAVALLGIGFADKVGLMITALRRLVLAVPKTWITFVLAFAGSIANVGGDGVNVFMLPAGGILYKAIGRSPVLGVAVAFASNSGTLGASPLVTTADIVKGELSTSAAQTVDPSVTVSAVSNYYFSFASSFLIAIVLTILVEKFLVKWYPALDGELDRDAEGIDTMTPEQKRGLRWAGWTLLGFLVALAAVALIPASPLASPTGSILDSPILEGLPLVIAVLFLACGIAYGIAVGEVRRVEDVPRLMTEGMKSFAPLLVIYFVLAQFVALLSYTQINEVTAMNGAELLESANFAPWVILLGILVVVSILNLFITSSSAQWAVISPILIPMLMLIDVPPDITQAAYRIADSCTGIITPVGASFVLALSFVRVHRPSAGIGTLIAVTLPMCLAMLVTWSAFFFLWLALGIPLGPGVPTSGFSLF